MLEFTALKQYDNKPMPVLLRAIDIIQVIEQETEVARKKFEKQVVLSMNDGSYVGVQESFDEVRERLSEYDLLNFPFIEFLSIMEEDEPPCRTLLRVGSIVSVSINDGQTQIEIKSVYNRQNVSLFVFTNEEYQTIKEKIFNVKAARYKKRKR